MGEMDIIYMRKLACYKQLVTRIMLAICSHFKNLNVTHTIFYMHLERQVVELIIIENCETLTL